MRERGLLRALLIVLALLPLSEGVAADLPSSIQRLVVRGYVHSVEGDGDRYTLKLGPRFSEAQANYQQAIIQHILTFVGLAYPSAQSLQVKASDGRELQVLDVEAARAAPSSN